jgi:hypothetical protein
MQKSTYEQTVKDKLPYLIKAFKEVGLDLQKHQL